MQLQPPCPGIYSPLFDCTAGTGTARVLLTALATLSTKYLIERTVNEWQPQNKHIFQTLRQKINQFLVMEGEALPSQILIKTAGLVW